MIEVFTEDSWSVVKSSLYWPASLSRPERELVYTRHKCSVKVPDQHTVTFIFGDTCKACNSPIPDSIKTLVILNNDSDTEVRYFTRIQP